MKKIKATLVIILINLLLVQSVFAQGLTLIVDGKDLTNLAAPFIRDNRTLVPIKFIGDALEAEVTWHEEEQMVTIEKDNLDLTLWIGSRIFLLNDVYHVSDVAPTIINDRTYVPVKLVANAFQVGVLWDGDKYQVTIDSDIKQDTEDFYSLNINLVDHQRITGNLTLSSDFTGSYDHVEIMIIDPATSKGYVRSRGQNTTLEYMPRPEDEGEKLLGYVIRNSSNEILSAKVVPVNISLNPVIGLKNITTGTYSSIDLVPEFNFEPRYVNYVITPENKDPIEITERDPYDTYQYTPDFKNNGKHAIQIVAYDSEGQSYYSPVYQVNLYADRYFYLSGVSNNQVVNKPVSLIGYRNFDVTNTKFFIKNPTTGEVTLLSDQSWGSYTFVPSKAYEGNQILYMTVVDTSGKVYTTPEKNIVIDMSPKMYLSGIGPNQIVTDSLSISITGNIVPESVTYYVLDAKDKVVLTSIEESLSYSPTVSGTYKMYATYTYEGRSYQTDTVTFKTYMGTLFGAKPIIEKDSFKSLASTLALNSMKETGMSASLQTAQAILETGWGQKLPVDKYSGQMSYNLFGIKGTGTIGSVISNTWEVYNGVSYRVDDYFRAYNNINESWADHKKILLNLSRYEPYRTVMYDSTKGAWAIRRCGYATDPKYPMKLIRIIDNYDLEILDQIQL
ncbi:MAG: glucosaminidase domain-containing protein [Clostridia bacterium]|nr:glucosaminidase domain-containing protein [Clostridia bacterium]